MQKKSLFQQNPHLRDAQSYKQALRVNVNSSMAIEGVRTMHRSAATGQFLNVQGTKIHHKK